MIGIKKYQRSASRLYAAVLALLFVLAAVWVISAFQMSVPWVRVSSHAKESGLSYGHAISIVTLTLFILALVRLAAMLNRVAAGDRFSRAVTRPFRDFALLLLLSSATALVAPLAAALLSQVPVAPAHTLEIRFELREAIFVIASLLLFLVARMLEDAADLEAELEGIL